MKNKKTKLSEEYYSNDGEFHGDFVAPCWNMDVILDTYTDWNSPQADKTRTIFGKEEKGLFYNYDDRLFAWDYDKANKAYEEAEKLAKPKTGKFYQIMLNLFHEALGDNVEVTLKHIIAGCNRSTGYPYLVFGYTTTPKKKTNEKP